MLHNVLKIRTFMQIHLLKCVHLLAQMGIMEVKYPSHVYRYVIMELHKIKSIGVIHQLLSVWKNVLQIHIHMDKMSLESVFHHVILILFTVLLIITQEHAVINVKILLHQRHMQILQLHLVYKYVLKDIMLKIQL